MFKTLTDPFLCFDNPWKSLNEPRPQEILLDFGTYCVVNYRTNKHPRVVEWLEAHSRFTLHFLPIRSSWLNLVERWFGEITRKRIRRGTFRSVPELTQAIYAYLRETNKAPRPFIWTATAAKIMPRSSIVMKRWINHTRGRISKRRLSVHRPAVEAE